MNPKPLNLHIAREGRCDIWVLSEKEARQYALDSEEELTCEPNIELMGSQAEDSGPSSSPVEEDGRDPNYQPSGKEDEPPRKKTKPNHATGMSREDEGSPLFSSSSSESSSTNSRHQTCRQVANTEGQASE